MKIRLNEDKAIVDAVRAALIENDGYCPCLINSKLRQNPDEKCPCKAFINAPTSGYCHCGLYYKDVNG